MTTDYTVTRIDRDGGAEDTVSVATAIDRLEPNWYLPGTVLDLAADGKPFQLASCSFIYKFTTTD